MKSGGNVSITAEERALYIAAHTVPQQTEEEVGSLMWNEEEELLSYDGFHSQPPLGIKTLRFFSIMVNVLLLGAIFSVTAGSARFCSTFFGCAKSKFSAQDKYNV